MVKYIVITMQMIKPMYVSPVLKSTIIAINMKLWRGLKTVGTFDVTFHAKNNIIE